MDIQKLGIKIFATAPASVALNEFIPVFHTWIQKHAIENHLLIDIHDYSHIFRGPGILLVAHEGNFSMDMADGRLGLLYYRKQPVAGPPEQQVAAIVKTALRACALLEQDPALSGRLRFNRDELLAVANDRLNTPNEPQTFEKISPVLATGAKAALGVPNVRIEAADVDSKERLTVRILTNAAPTPR